MEMAHHPSNAVLRKRPEETKTPTNLRTTITVHDINLHNEVIASCCLGAVLCNICKSGLSALEWGNWRMAQI
jgi:hypothetical protein